MRNHTKSPNRILNLSSQYGFHRWSTTQNIIISSVVNVKENIKRDDAVLKLHDKSKMSLDQGSDVEN